MFLLVFLLLLHFHMKCLNSSTSPWPDSFQFGPMIQQVTHYSQIANGPRAPIGAALSHAQSLRDFPSAPLLLNAKKCVNMPYFSWGTKKPQEPIRSAMIDFAVLSKFGKTFKTLLLMNHCCRCHRHQLMIVCGVPSHPGFTLL